MAIRSRPMRAEDIPECVDIVAKHPVTAARYGNAIRDLPPAWSRMLEYEARSATVFEHVEDSRSNICGVGMSVFVTDAFIREIKSKPLRWIGPELTRRIVRGNSPVISYAGMRESNSIGGMNLLVWEGSLLTEFQHNSEAQRAIINTFIKEHRGYLWKEVIGSQALSPEWLEWMVKTGGLVWNPEDLRYVDLSELNAAEIVKKPHLIGVTPGLEIAEEASWIGGLFDYAPPCFGFSQSEQKLLVGAVDGEGTDLELAAALGVSLPTIKKMWSSIYRRVAENRAEIISERAHLEKDESSRGREKRRRLLTYLREHPEELRPYSLRLVKQKYSLSQRARGLS